MSAALFDHLVEQTEQLTLEEQLALVARIVERARNNAKTKVPSATGKRNRWLDASGLVKEPLFLEDAQAWVTRTRQEGDEQRERQWMQPR
jgi:hypothetical protein